MNSYEVALAYNKSDPYLFYALAEVCRRLGHATLAKRYFTLCFELAKKVRDDDLLSKLSKVGAGGDAFAPVFLRFAK